MAARPPQNDPEEPESLAFGIAALTEHLDRAEVAYPADAATITEATSDPEVPYDPSGHTVALSTALDDTDHTEFDSEGDLLDALHPVFEARRRSASSGVLGRLRSLF